MQSPRNLPEAVSPEPPHGESPVVTGSPRISPSLPAGLPHQSPRPPLWGGEAGRFRGHPGEGPAEDLKPNTFSESLAREWSEQQEYDMTSDSPIPEDLPEWLLPHAMEVADWHPVATARVCWVGECDRDAHLHGLCKAHHARARRQWNPAPSDRRRRWQPMPESPSALETVHGTSEGVIPPRTSERVSEFGGEASVTGETAP